MLLITIPAEESWDDVKEEFVITRNAITLQLEHSLVSLAKWESKWHKVFLSRNPKTAEEILDYIKCMTITQNVNPETYNYLTKDNVIQIQEYIDDPMTATVISDNENSKGSRETVTAELIYYWMIASNIPFDPCQKWHLNRLLTLIKVCGIKNSPPKKRSKRDLMRRNAALNAARRQQLNSRGLLILINLQRRILAFEISQTRWKACQ